MKSLFSYINIAALLWYGLLVEDFVFSRWLATLIFFILLAIFAVAMENSVSYLDKELDDGSKQE